MVESRILADAVLVIHAAFVGFVVFGQAYVLLGWKFRWQGARHRWFRHLHLAAIAVVVVQAWIGLHCPLTLLEADLRSDAGGVVYEQSFVQHWLSRILYYNLPQWVFTLAYTLFGALVVLSYFKFPPRARHSRPGTLATGR